MIRLDNYTAEFSRLIRRATALLGEPALPLEFDWGVEQAVLKVARRLRSEGLDQEPALLCITTGRGGRDLTYGAERCAFSIEGEPDVELVRFELPHCGLPDFWAVKESDCRRFYRAARRLVRKQRHTPQPLLAEETRQKLWDNTVGFLLRENEVLERYQIAKKRGLLLTGEPGNGKTMACRWLFDQCARRGIDWNTVSMEDFETARHARSISSLFSTDGPGVVLFDDFDVALTRRDRSHDQFNQATFLSELDGVNNRAGTVYLFTSNMAITDIDPAMRRPGRIDVILSFPAPDEALRRKFVLQRWPREAICVASVEELVADTAGMSFAELEEARKLLILRYLDEGAWHWQETKALLRRANQGEQGRPIGFSQHPENVELALTQTAASAK
ncbi:MAG: ATP-binding protein [Pirellulales bacterium]|nr:ATP-binding protein [Pirellulales bacterium]